MKKVYIVHGWGGTPEEGWFPWLKKELEAQDYTVCVPQLPNAERPRIDTWIPALAEAVGTPTPETFFVGHSMGCQAIARYLATLPRDARAGGVVYVAGFFKRLTGLDTDPAVWETMRHWLNTPIDLASVRKNAPNSVAIFSDNDPWVPLDNQDDFKDLLGSKIIIEHNAGHFSGGRDGTTQLSVALEQVLHLA